MYCIHQWVINNFNWYSYVLESSVQQIVLSHEIIQEKNFQNYCYFYQYLNSYLFRWLSLGVYQVCYHFYDAHETIHHI